MLNLPIHSADDLYKHGLALLDKELPLKLRLMGLRYAFAELCIDDRMTHLCPRGKIHGDLDKASLRGIIITDFSSSRPCKFRRLIPCSTNHHGREKLTGSKRMKRTRRQRLGVRVQYVVSLLPKRISTVTLIFV